MKKVRDQIVVYYNQFYIKLVFLNIPLLIYKSVVTQMVFRLVLSSHWVINVMNTTQPLTYIHFVFV
jgi:hypothetical protein